MDILRISVPTAPFGSFCAAVVKKFFFLLVAGLAALVPPCAPIAVAWSPFCDAWQQICVCLRRLRSISQEDEPSF